MIDSKLNRVFTLMEGRESANSQERILMETFTCEGCDRVLPRYINGIFQPACGMNMGWGMMEWCRECRPSVSTGQIISDMELFMFPKEE